MIFWGGRGMLTNLNVDKRPRWWSTSVNVIAHLLHRRRKDVWMNCSIFQINNILRYQNGRQRYFDIVKNLKKISRWRIVIIQNYGTGIQARYYVSLLCIFGRGVCKRAPTWCKVYYKSMKYEVDVIESQKYHSLKVTPKLQAPKLTPSDSNWFHSWE